MKHIVMFSGGAGSWATARRVAQQHGTDDLFLLFADTLIEDGDLYRFLEDAAANVGGTLVKVADGRDPWQIFFAERFLGNSRIDPCSKLLKRKLLRRYIDARFNPDTTTIYLGIDWTEQHRINRAADYWGKWAVKAPMCEPPYLDKRDMIDLLRAEGIEPPRLYALGFPHNNCGGFCIKAGQAHFRLLLKTMPERFAYHEAKEQEFRTFIGRDVSILKETVDGELRRLTLSELRRRVEDNDNNVDLFEWGGCGCFSGT